MAIPQSELETMRDALVRSRASGTNSVTFDDGRRVDYKSDSEMAAAIADIEARINRASGHRPTSIRPFTSKGF